ncbi:glutamine synthetase III family protein [Anaeropeptidivorans aminofermentans]|uniref:glutamine synthetase III family protein n=1 Tax=Anaeropeptidivorans aminofermentans TaxID=2934315 RepID=UPI00202421FB|nr:glutamine synthetase III [Anaeropeptidivorans aminofermentans]
MRNPLDNFGSMVFGEKTMKEKLPRDIYRALKNCIRQGKSLDPNLADVIANAMKEWAVEKGVTHFTHWFQPMTGITAEKHDSFLTPINDGTIISQFSGRGLIKGEPDASSFPSGGIRATFEARGYTAWDPSSYVFIKENTLCIPTAFYSYSGQALDKKTPLLRSMEALNRQAVKVLNLMGYTDITHISATVGPEQEYFLIDKEVYKKRKDLFNCGRTLFGAKPPKGQELDDHYYGALRPRVIKFMRELDEELWKLGIFAKTEHNEVAPSQHELAPLYMTVNIATDHNQLTMEMMKKVADRNGLACLLHEKPFAGVNGSGKHNNWSLLANTDENIFDPGDDPAHNTRFLLFLSAVIKGVHKYQDLIRISVASASNDHRLGANEAPPAIVSIFLGDEITSVLEAIEMGNNDWRYLKENMFIGTHVLPTFAKDNTDRNRTSPIAFTGNKFEFRMPGSSFSISDINTAINTAVADELEGFFERLNNSSSVEDEIYAIIRDTYAEHKKIIFNGNSYSEEWVKESEERGLLNLKTTVDAAPHLINSKNIALYARQKVFSETEIRSRYEIILENYCKTINIEALTMLDMAYKSIIPSVSMYIGELSDIVLKKRAFMENLSCEAESELIIKLSSLQDSLYKKVKNLEGDLIKVRELDGKLKEKADFYRNYIFIGMQELRAVADEMEPLVSEKHWPFPTYSDILFSV